MSRLSRLTSTDCETLSRLLAEAQIELMKWQKYTHPYEQFLLNRKSILNSDLGSMVALINLSNKIQEIRERK